MYNPRNTSTGVARNLVVFSNNNYHVTFVILPTIFQWQIVLGNYKVFHLLFCRGPSRPAPVGSSRARATRSSAAAPGSAAGVRSSAWGASVASARTPGRRRRRRRQYAPLHHYGQGTPAHQQRSPRRRGTLALRASRRQDGQTSRGVASSAAGSPR